MRKKQIIEELEQKIKELQEEIQKLKEKPSKVWKPKTDDYYWRIIPNNIALCLDWYDSSFDKDNYAIGNCFRTKEEAEFAIEKLKVIAELKRFAEEYNDGELDWNYCKQTKYYLIYIYNPILGNGIKIDYAQNCRGDNTYFTSYDIAKNAIQAIGEERLKKYYFEVKDE